MLPRSARLTRSSDFGLAVRTGRRAGTRVLVTHLAPHLLHGESLGPRVGLVVSRAVGGAAVRNRVKRRLRHLLAERLDRLPADTAVVVRALPASAGASYVELGRALDSTLARCTAQDAAPS